MTTYNTSSFGPPPVLMVGGRSEFLYGGFADNVSPTLISISSVSITSNVATVTGTIVSGNVPATGAIVSIQGVQVSGGIFNVQNLAINPGTFNAQGVGTFTFSLTNANVSTTPASGFAKIPQALTYDTLAAGSSRQAASAENDPSENDERSYFAQVYFGSIPTAVTVTLQASLTDNDADYQTVGTVATVAGSAVTQSAATFSGMNYKFLRFNVSGLTGTGTIAAAILG